ncbi:MAG TPA: hypothetical protein VE669_10465 [Actinomycetota bacterium]|nr:hypothetical protein [Actinomycetota bacterium]
MSDRKQKRRFIERAVLGTFMGLAAFIIEWRVRRALRRGETERGGER